MTKIDIYSGFLGAGKTTLIKKMIKESYAGEKLVLIENEFGQIGIDSGFLQDAGIQVTEMNSGCICCSLVGDFSKALTQVIDQYAPDRVIIEPSGVGKLSDVISAVEKSTGTDAVLGCAVAVVDASKVKVYMKNFGEFYNDQIKTASTIVLSRTDNMPQQKLDTAISMLREHNPTAAIVTTPWTELTGDQMKEAMEGVNTVHTELEQLKREVMEHHGHHNHDDHHEHHCCGHHGHHEHDEDHEHHCCGHHGHHEHDEDHEHHCCGHHGHHEHDEDHEHHCCGHHDHEHHHGEHCGCHHHGHDHHAEEVFASWGVETHKKFTENELRAALLALDTGRFGVILRAKGIVSGTDGTWIHFDYVPGEINIRTGAAAVIGRLCVIGAQLAEHGVNDLFGV